MTFSIKTKIKNGEDSLTCLSEIDAGRIFLITDPFIKKNGLTDVILNKIPKDCDVHIFTDVRPDPSQELVDKASAECHEFNPDAVIALGGGSAIDLAKAMKAIISERYGKDRSILIAIPTTAGTGSEVTNFAVITRGHDKIVLVDDQLLPDYALLIPSLTKSIPSNVTADTGMDVLTHALEAYMSTSANLFTDVYAVKAIRLVFKNLNRVFEDGSLLKCRGAMLDASCMAGIAFTNAGLGINHSLAHTIGGRYHIPHGRLNAVILPFVIGFNTERSLECSERMKDLAHELDMNSLDELIETIKILRNMLGIPEKLSQLNKIDADDYFNNIGNMAESAMTDRCTPTSPGYLTKFDLQNILKDVF